MAGVGACFFKSGARNTPCLLPLGNGVFLNMGGAKGEKGGLCATNFRMSSLKAPVLLLPVFPPSQHSTR